MRAAEAQGWRAGSERGCGRGNRCRMAGPSAVGRGAAALAHARQSLVSGLIAASTCSSSLSSCRKAGSFGWLATASWLACTPRPWSRWPPSEVRLLPSKAPGMCLESTAGRLPQAPQSTASSMRLGGLRSQLCRRCLNLAPLPCRPWPLPAGACPAGGCCLAMCCDYRVMTEAGSIGGCGRCAELSVHRCWRAREGGSRPQLRPRQLLP